MDGLPLQVMAERVVRDHVHERAQGRRDAHAVDRLHVVILQPRTMQMENGGSRGHPPKAGRNGHVQSPGHRIRQLMQRQRCRVAERALRFAGPVVRPELPEYEIRPCRRRKPDQPVNAAALAYPVADPDVVRVRVVRVADLPGLPGCEVPALAFGQLVEAGLERLILPRVL